jgi:hypothetical protein
MALKLWDFGGFHFSWMNVTFQDLSYDMLPEKIQIILN